MEKKLGVVHVLYTSFDLRDCLSLAFLASKHITGRQMKMTTPLAMITKIKHFGMRSSLVLHVLGC